MSAPVRPTTVTNFQAPTSTGRLKTTRAKAARRNGGAQCAGAYRGDAGTLSFLSPGGVLSAFSVRSILSFASLLSIGSAGSILSIGSAGSILSIGGAGTILNKSREGQDEDER